MISRMMEVRVLLALFWIELIYVSKSGSFFFLRFYLVTLRREGKEKEGERKHQCVVASHKPPTGDLAHNPGLCLIGN